MVTLHEIYKWHSLNETTAECILSLWYWSWWVGISKIGQSVTQSISDSYYAHVSCILISFISCWATLVFCFVIWIITKLTFFCIISFKASCWIVVPNQFRHSFPCTYLFRDPLSVLCVISPTAWRPYLSGG